MITAAALFLAGMALPSCTAVGAAITGQAPAATGVQRSGHPDAPVVMVAAGDLAEAESRAEAASLAKQPPPVHGLYDAGRAASAIREVFTESGK